MEIFSLSLILQHRRERRSLLRFLDTLELYLRGGYELAYAWELAQEVEPLSLIKLPEKGSLLSHLHNLPGPYFKMLHLLYSQGASIVEAVHGITVSLRLEEKNDLESHLRQLPLKMQILSPLFLSTHCISFDCPCSLIAGFSIRNALKRFLFPWRGPSPLGM